MDQKTIEEIRRSLNKPTIGVIGAAMPDDDYNSDRGISVGYALREFLKYGSIITGGAKGVGVDINKGVIKYCLEQPKNVHSNFAILVPEHVGINNEGKLKGPVPYNIPEEYEINAKENNENLEVYIAGYDLHERTESLAKIADVLILLNGNIGSFSEVLEFLKEKPVIAMRNTGGNARRLYRASKGNLSALDEDYLNRNNISFGDVNFKNLSYAFNSSSMVHQLVDILR